MPQPAPSPSPSPMPLTTNVPQLKGCAQGLAIPSYFYPGALWSQAQAAKAGIVIINPASGPGAVVDANYVNTVNSMKAAGETGQHQYCTVPALYIPAAVAAAARWGMRMRTGLKIGWVLRWGWLSQV